MPRRNNYLSMVKCIHCGATIPRLDALVLEVTPLTFVHVSLSDCRRISIRSALLPILHIAPLEDGEVAEVAEDGEVANVNAESVS